MRSETIIHFDRADAAEARLFDSPERYLFRNNELIAGMPEEAFERFSSQISIIHYEPGEIIFHEHEPGDCLYLIAQGSVKISKRGRGGQQETLTHLSERDFFGEMALVDREPRSAQASAHGHTVLGRVNHDAWTLLFQLAPQEVVANFTRTFTKRLRHNNQHFIEEMMRNERLSLLGSTISSIVHDMNNPIACILGACEVMQTKIQDELTTQMTGLIRESVERMEAMTRELIDFSRGNTQLHPQPVPLAQLVKGLESDFRACEEAKVQVQRTLAYDGPVQVDFQRILRVFSNLIGNARDAMKKNGTGLLAFRAERLADEVVFGISDSGCGIAPELLPRIFEPFVTHGKSNGTGLGLAIAKAIVEAHGGTITVRSVLGAGTSFQIRLPVVP